MNMKIEQYIKNGKIKILVKPNSNKNEIKEWDEKRQGLKVNINAQPEDNKANTELIKFLSKTLKKKVRIKTGFSSREKIIEIVP